jgi:cytochrome c
MAADRAVDDGYIRRERPGAKALNVVVPEEIRAPGVNAVAFTPPEWSAIPDTPLGDMIRIGRDVFVDTQRYAKPFVGNKLNCVNCHLDGGRQANSAPLWAAYVAYPSFRSKNKQINGSAGVGRRRVHRQQAAAAGSAVPKTSADMTSSAGWSFR